MKKGVFSGALSVPELFIIIGISSLVAVFFTRLFSAFPVGQAGTKMNFEISGSPAYPVAAGHGPQNLGVMRLSTSQDILLDMGTADAAPWGFWLQAHNVANTNSFPILLNPNGANVGIGTDNPAATLDVNGGIRPGNVVIGAECEPEGALGYDLTAHMPSFCGQLGHWLPFAKTRN